MTIRHRFDHPACQLFPRLGDNQLRELAADIKANGLRNPIVLRKGRVLDGRNRLLACELADVMPINTEFTGTQQEAFAFAWSQNFTRRHLDPSQAAAAVELRKRQDEDFAAEISTMQAEANAKQTAGKGADGSGGRGRKKTLANELAKVSGHRTLDRLAKSCGTNRAYLDVAAKLADHELEELRDGKKKMPEVIREQKRKLTVAHLEELKTRKAKAVKGIFDVLVIDPPWPMGKKIERNVAPNQVEFDYPTMTLDELRRPEKWYGKKLPAAKDCHIWLWTTQRFLPKAFRLLKVWGIKYVCTFVWRKRGGIQPFDLPQYNCEFALYGRIGTPRFIDAKAFRTCFHGKRGRHSEKPSEFYQMVRRVTAGRRLDMFGRRKIDGFECWGKEAPACGGKTAPAACKALVRKRLATELDKDATVNKSESLTMGG